MLRMAGRYYRSIPIDETGYETTEIGLDPAKTTLIAMHCWDIGCEGGPGLDGDFCVGMGYPEVFAEAERIMRECIRPAMDAARKAGVLVSHVEGESIAVKYPQSQEELSPRAAPVPGSGPGPVVPGWREQIVARSHGADYASRSPYARMDRAKVVAPEPGEPLAYETDQFDRQLRKRGIENLIYTGFATDMCILRAPGGIEPMAGYGYRIYLVRDATIGVELPTNFEERVATRWAIGYFETHYGETILTDDFVKACKAIA